MIMDENELMLNTVVATIKTNERGKDKLPQAGDRWHFSQQSLTKQSAL